MITRSEFTKAQQTAVDLLRKTGVFIRDTENDQIAVADFGLSDLENFGAQILTLVNTEKLAVKLIALHPFQILPEHWHPRMGEYEGKEETLRVEWGEMYLYSPGNPTPNPKAKIPIEKKKYLKNWCETIVVPGDMVTFPPHTPHWFQAGPEGVVVWSFSTQVLDLKDKFTDPYIKRQTTIKEDG